MMNNLISMLVVLSMLAGLAGRLSAQYQHGLGPEAEWTMKNGRQAKAKYLQIDQDKLFLEFPNGKIFSYPLASFVEESQLLARDRQEQFPIAASFQELLRLEDKVTFAKEALLLYEQFLDFELNKQKTEDIQRAREKLTSLEELAQKDCIRVGNRYLTRDEILETRKRNEELILSSLEAARAEDWSRSKSLLERSERFDPSSFHANFLLGMLAALVDQDLDQAESMFTICVTRGTRYATVFEDSGRNLAAALVNLGLLKMRGGNLAEAESCFREAVQADPALLEVVLMNCDRMQRLIRFSVTKGNLPMVKLTEKSSEIIDELVNDLNPQEQTRYTPANGWIHVCHVAEDQKLNALPFEPRLSGGRISLAKAGQRPAILDQSCNYCLGRAVLDCLERKCSKGTVQVFRKRAIPAPSGGTIVQGAWVAERCRVCNGAGGRPCTECRNGVDTESYR